MNRLQRGKHYKTPDDQRENNGKEKKLDSELLGHYKTLKAMCIAR